MGAYTEHEETVDALNERIADDDRPVILGYISAPTGAGRHYAEHGTGWGFRGRAPRWHASRREAVAGCRAIERAGRRDGGRGRDCYIVIVYRHADGRVEVSAGDTTDTGLYLGGGVTIRVGCGVSTEDAVTWLSSRPKRWLASHGINL